MLAAFLLILPQIYKKVCHRGKNLLQLTCKKCVSLFYFNIYFLVTLKHRKGDTSQLPQEDTNQVVHHDCNLSHDTVIQPEQDAVIGLEQDNM